MDRPAWVTVALVMLGMVATIAVTTGEVAFWASGLQADVSALKLHVAAIDSGIAALNTSRENTAQSIIRLQDDVRDVAKQTGAVLEIVKQWGPAADDNRPLESPAPAVPYHGRRTSGG